MPPLLAQRIRLVGGPFDGETFITNARRLPVIMVFNDGDGLHTTRRHSYGAREATPEHEVPTLATDAIFGNRTIDEAFDAIRDHMTVVEASYLYIGSNDLVTKAIWGPWTANKSKD